MDLISGYQRGLIEGERQRQMALWQAMMNQPYSGGYDGGGYDDGGGYEDPEPDDPTPNVQTELGTPDPRGFFRRKPQGGGQIL